MAKLQDFIEKRVEAMNTLEKTHPDHLEEIQGKKEAFQEVLSFTSDNLVDSLIEAIEKAADEEVESTAKGFYQGRMKAFEETLSWVEKKS